MMNSFFLNVKLFLLIKELGEKAAFIRSRGLLSEIKSLKEDIANNADKYIFSRVQKFLKDQIPSLQTVVHTYD